jgi:hypothetical protein
MPRTILQRSYYSGAAMAAHYEAKQCGLSHCVDNIACGTMFNARYSQYFIEFEQ